MAFQQQPTVRCIRERRPTKTFADWPMTTKTLNAQTCAFLYHVLCLYAEKEVRYWAQRAPAKANIFPLKNGQI